MILIVDDNQDICTALERLIKSYGYEAECLNDGRDALSRLRDVSPQLVVLDDMMPDMSGLDLLRAIAADPDLPKVPVIMYSAGADEGRRREALQLGAVDWVNKGQTGWLALLDKVKALLPS